MTASIHIVDDDADVRGALTTLLSSVRLEVTSHESAESFLAVVGDQSEGCVVTDLRLPGMSGLELHERLVRQGSALPVIFLSGFPTVPIVVRAMQNGAVTFLKKPCEDQEILDAVHAALRKNQSMLASQTHHRAAAGRLASLSPAERSVLDLMLSGSTNKEIAFSLSVPLRTVESRRQRVFRKLAVANLTELVRLHCLAVGAGCHR